MSLPVSNSGYPREGMTVAVKESTSNTAINDNGYEEEVSKKLSKLGQFGVYPNINTHTANSNRNRKNDTGVSHWKYTSNGNSIGSEEIDLQLPSNAEVNGALPANLDNEAYFDFPSKESWYESNSITSATPPSENVYFTESYQVHDDNGYTNGVQYFVPQHAYNDYVHAPAYITSVPLATSGQRSKIPVLREHMQSSTNGATQPGYYASAYVTSPASENLLVDMANNQTVQQLAYQNGMICHPIGSPLPNGNFLTSNGNGNGTSQTQSPSQANNLYKTELCRSWEETGQCRYGNKCQV